MNYLKKHQIPFFLIVVAIASIVGINQYHFGMWNQYISLPWLYELIDPSQYPHDLLVEQYDKSPTFFLLMLKGALPLFGNNIPLLFFSFYAICLGLTVYSFYQLGKGLFNSKEVGILAVILMSFSFPVIGDVNLWDTLLMERTITYPILLLSLVHLYRGKTWYAVILQGLAFNIHPLSAIYVMGASGIALLWSQGFKREYIWQAATGLLLCIPVLLMKFGGADSGESSITFSGTWMEVMRLRNGHHTFPSEFPPAIFFKSGLMLLSYFVILRKGNFSRSNRRFLEGIGLSIIAMIIIGTIFTELIPVKLIIQFQFYRAFLFLSTLTIVLWAGMLITNPKPIFYLLIIPILSQYIYGEWSKTISAFALIASGWFFIRFYGLSLKTSITMSGAFLTLGLVALMLRGGINIEQGSQEKDWYEVQDWFRQHTAADALAIVPPSEAGFRVRSLRTSYGDWFDGTKAFFSEEYAAHWLDHMSNLNCTNPNNLKEDYQALSHDDFMKIWEMESLKHSEAYIVHFADKRIEKLPIAFKNERFVVYHLGASEAPLLLASIN